ncbi:MAG TPA: hypothetical protein VH373_06535 [Jatrophihabitantaceae bacterium]|jgi:hypothetical protein
MALPGVAASSVAWVVAAADNSGGGEAKKAGPIALAVILVLCVACYFLFRSMTRHLRKVREEFPRDDDPARPPEPADPRDIPGTSSPRRPVNGTSDKPPPS